jgi:fatty-acyl-CoA synthase
VGVPDERWGERPLATVVAPDVSVEELRTFLAGRIAKWQLPRYWAFIEQVPRTSVGKYDKKQVRAWYAEGRLNLIESAEPH